MQKYKYILFDWDGTLARTLDVWLRTLRTALENRGYDFTDAEIGANYDLFKKRFEAKGYTGADEILKEALDEADSHILNVELYSSALETLENVHNSGRKTALVTTSTHSHIDSLLKYFGLVDLFDSVICGDDTILQKPDPEPVVKAMQMLDASKEYTLLIGDSEKDILAAHNAGVSSMLFYPESHKKYHDFEILTSLKPTFIIHDLSEVNLLLDSN